MAKKSELLDAARVAYVTLCDLADINAGPENYWNGNEPGNVACRMLYHAIAQAGGQGCEWSDRDECSTARERTVAGLSDTIPACPVHGPFTD